MRKNLENNIEYVRKKIDIWNQIKRLIDDPSWALTKECDLPYLASHADPHQWFFLLMQQPDFGKNTDWFSYRNISGLPWARLLRIQPQFFAYCHFEALSRSEMIKMHYWTPEIEEKIFPTATDYSVLFHFLTSWEIVDVLSEIPELSAINSFAGWQKRIHPTYLWLRLLSVQPQFSVFADLHLLRKENCIWWEMLLEKQPQFAKYCNFSRFGCTQASRLLRKQPELLRFF